MRKLIKNFAVILCAFVAGLSFAACSMSSAVITIESLLFRDALDDITDTYIRAYAVDTSSTPTAVVHENVTQIDGSNVIEIRANLSRMIELDLRKYFSASNILGRNFYFTRSDCRWHSAENGDKISGSKLVKGYAYENLTPSINIGHEDFRWRRVDSSSPSVNEIDYNGPVLLKGLYDDGEYDYEAETGSVEREGRTVVYIGIDDDAATFGVLGKTVTFTFYAHNGSIHTLTVKVVR